MSRTLRPFSHYEIQRVAELDGDCQTVDTDEELESVRRYADAGGHNLKVFWTLYGRYDPDRGPDGFGGVTAIADRETWDECAELLESILGVPLGELGSDEPWPAHPAPKENRCPECDRDLNVDGHNALCDRG